MSEVKPTVSPSDPNEEEPTRGPNLTLIYTLIVLAMIAAVAVAAFIVLPFYHRR
jgi:hypothetical protein